MITKLNLPEYEFRLQPADDAGKMKIFDVIRKKYIVLTPEEWVRQNFIHFLIHEKHYPPSLIAVEKQLKYHTLNKRSDIVIYDNKGKPVLIVECKAPEVKLNQDVFHQIARYNYVLRVDYLIVTNGLEHYCCSMDYSAQSYEFVKEIPPCYF